MRLKKFILPLAIGLAVVVASLAISCAKAKPPAGGSNAPTQTSPAVRGDRSGLNEAQEEAYRRMYETYRAMILNAAKAGDKAALVKLTDTYNESIAKRLLLACVYRKLPDNQWELLFAGEFERTTSSAAIKYASWDKVHVSDLGNFIQVETGSDEHGNVSDNLHIVLCFTALAPPGWGETVNGLCARLVVKKQVLVAADTENFVADLQIRNASDRPISIIQGNPFLVEARVTGADGKAVEPEEHPFDYTCSPCSVRLAPGETASIRVSPQEFDVAHSDGPPSAPETKPVRPAGLILMVGPTWTLPVGRYSLAAAYTIKDWGLAFVKDKPSDAWTGKLSAPAATIEVRAAQPERTEAVQKKGR